MSSRTDLIVFWQNETDSIITFLANTFFTPVKGVTQYRIIKSDHTNILKMARLQISLSSWLIILLLSQPNTLITKKDKAVRAL